MTLNSFSVYAQCAMEYTTRTGRRLSWDNDEAVWHDDDWELVLSEDQLGDLSVVSFSVYGVGVKVRLDIE